MAGITQIMQWLSGYVSGFVSFSRVNDWIRIIKVPLKNCDKLASGYSCQIPSTALALITCTTGWPLFDLWYLPPIRARFKAAMPIAPAPCRFRYARPLLIQKQYATDEIPYNMKAIHIMARVDFKDDSGNMTK